MLIINLIGWYLLLGMANLLFMGMMYIYEGSEMPLDEVFPCLFLWPIHLCLYLWIVIGDIIRWLS